MKLKFLPHSLLAIGAILATSASRPAEAMTFRGSVGVSSIPTNAINSVTATSVDFNNDPGVFTVNNGTGDFAGLVGGAVRAVNDIDLNTFTGNLELLSFSGGLSFFVTEFTSPTFISLANGGFSSELRGFFSDGSSSNPVAPSSFVFAVNGNGVVPDQADFSLATVPTPALLPGLIGMGVAALRKRREDGEETVEA